MASQQSEKAWRQVVRWLTGGRGLVIAAVAASLAMIAVGSRRPLSTLELLLFQIIVMGLGLWGSYLWGRQSAEQAAASMVRPHVRKAFRRLVRLYLGLQTIGQSIVVRRGVLVENRNHDGSIDMSHVSAAFDLLEAQVVDQIGTADDAMEDWRDILPTEVAEIEQASKKASER